MLARFASKTARALTSSTGTRATSTNQNLDLILGGDLSLNPLGATKAAAPEGRPVTSANDTLFLSEDLVFSQSDAQAIAHAKDVQDLNAFAEKILSKAGSNWELEFTTLRYEKEASKTVSKEAQSDW
eukprot:CAMPEP_0181313014 /NCGR_PEP_ID=MMETSP1101-20121128/14014_1 /TAXON_ID=46948 /ORGANISM="Rhodomonas abbreviata, Strain Caron Lab Isolate" /LENGTH=126 /DNA_ID=CAMNT_0023419923 /DNA_START=56 /DNA_END=433 /DNA_ORIENTATION=+